MARTWSNTKRIPDERSAAQRAKLGRPSGVTAFLVALILVTVFFLGLTLYSAFVAEQHPMTEVSQPVNDPPKDE